MRLRRSHIIKYRSIGAIDLFVKNLLLSLDICHFARLQYKTRLENMQNGGGSDSVANIIMISQSNPNIWGLNFYEH